MNILSHHRCYRIIAVIAYCGTASNARFFAVPDIHIGFIRRILTLPTSVSRTVVVDGLKYTIDIMVSSPLHRDRLGSGWYILVELPGSWKAVFGAPPGTEDMSHLSYAQLVAYVHEAQRLVALRSSGRDAHTD